MIAGLLSIHVSAPRARTSRWSPRARPSTHCIGEAAQSIEYGDADVMVAGGAEATMTPLGVGGFCAARALSTRNDDPATRQPARGTAIATASCWARAPASLVLEEYEHAKARGARSTASSPATA